MPKSRLLWRRSCWPRRNALVFLFIEAVSGRVVGVAYVLAALRTLRILALLFVLLLFGIVVIAGSISAFHYSFAAGSVTLAGIAGVFSLFGHQLANIAKASSTKRIGTYTRLCCGAVAVFGLVLSLATYGYVTVQQMRAPSDSWPGTPVTDPSALKQLNSANTGRTETPAPPAGFVLDAPEPQQPRRTPATDAVRIKAHCDALASNFGKLADYYAALAKCYAAYPSIGIFDDVIPEPPVMKPQ